MKVDLLEMLARICYCAQESICDPVFYSTQIGDRKTAFMATSYVIAWFLAEYTGDGTSGVGTEIVLEQLADNTLNEKGLMFKSHAEWANIISGIADEMGGFQK